MATTTLQDIADHLGLSRATVSRALNGFPEVGQKTRERVQAAARQFNYQPNLNARQLATGRTGMVAMMLLLEQGRIQDVNELDFMTGLSMAVKRLGLDMIFHVITRIDDLDAYQRFLNRGAVDGMILNRPGDNDPRIELLQRANMPFVMHGRADGEVSYAYYDIDNEGAFTCATRLLLDLGHRHITFINGPASMSFACQRERGARHAYHQRQLDPTTLVHINTDLTESSGYHYALQVLNGEFSTKPTAFLCSSTAQAAGIYRAIAQLQLVVGQDISVIAHDDDVPHWQAAQFDPPLTVTRVPICDACEPLATMIGAVIRGTDPLTLQHTAKADLIVRESTSAPKN